MYAEFILEHVIPLCLRTYEEQQLRENHHQQQESTNSIPSRVVIDWETSPMNITQICNLFRRISILRNDCYKRQDGRVVKKRRQILQSQSQSTNVVTTNSDDNTNKNHKHQSAGYLKLYQSVYIWNYICKC